MSEPTRVSVSKPLLLELDARVRAMTVPHGSTVPDSLKPIFSAHFELLASARSLDVTSPHLMAEIVKDALALVPTGAENGEKVNAAMRALNILRDASPAAPSVEDGTRAEFKIGDVIVRRGTARRYRITAVKDQWVEVCSVHDETWTSSFGYAFLEAFDVEPAARPSTSPVAPAFDVLRDELERTWEEFWRTDGSRVAETAMWAAIRSIIEHKEPDASPVSSLEEQPPQTLEHEGKEYRNFGSWGEPHVRAGDLIYFSDNRFRRSRADYELLSDREKGWLQCAAYADASLYRPTPEESQQPAPLSTVVQAAVATLNEFGAYVPVFLSADWVGKGVKVTVEEIQAVVTKKEQAS